jgi:3-deoxy-D-manno-octulosonate 8-phosphate phosphatase (KDO 8-P phosphatase)
VIALADLLVRAARIRLVLLDVDGVLTDGRIWFGPDGEALKAFDVRDGHGIVRLRDQVDFGVISGRPGRATQKRLEELGFKHLIFSQRDKLDGYAKLAPLGFADEEVAYMGDDVNDLPLLLPGRAIRGAPRLQLSRRTRRRPGAVRAHPEGERGAPPVNDAPWAKRFGPTSWNQGKLFP